MLFKYCDLIHEVGIHSQLNDEFIRKEKIELSNFKFISLNKKSIKQYHLNHIRDNCIGSIYVDNKNELVCFIAVEEKENKERWIQGLEVSKEYRGHGLSEELLKESINKYKADHLSVNKNNEVAIYIYKKFGFEIYKETDIMYFMINK